jgi:hypothetical protein
VTSNPACHKKYADVAPAGPEPTTQTFSALTACLQGTYP